VCETSVIHIIEVSFIYLEVLETYESSEVSLWSMIANSYFWTF